MDKLKFIGWVLAAVTFAYIPMTILMPMLTSTVADAVTSIQASPNAALYVLSIAASRYTPLALYFIPAAIGITAIVFKLRQAN